MNPLELRRTAHLLDPARWAEEVLGWHPHPFQTAFYARPRVHGGT